MNPPSFRKIANSEQTATKFHEFLKEIQENQHANSAEKEQETLKNFLNTLNFAEKLPNEQIIKEMFEKNLIYK